MNLIRGGLLISLITAWVSVLIKYETLAFISASSNDNNQNSPDGGGGGGASRIRQTLRETYHRVVDKEPKEEAPGESGTRRIRQTIRETYHKIVDKPGQKTQAPSTQRPAKGASKSNSKQAQQNTKSQDSKYIFETLARKISSSDLAKKNLNNHYYSSGYFNSYNYRPGGFAEIRTSLCTNYIEYEGIVFGQFYCPIEGFEADDTLCCGPMKEQYCCNLSTYNSLKVVSVNESLEQTKRAKDTIIFIMIILVPITFFILLMTGFFIFCCVVNRRYAKLHKTDQPILASERELGGLGKDKFEEDEDDDDDDEWDEDEDDEDDEPIEKKAKADKVKKVEAKNDKLKGKKKSAEV